MAKHYGVSDDEEVYYGDYKTRKEAIKNATKHLELVDEDVFFTGAGERKKYIGYCNVDGLIENTQEMAYEMAGECAEDFGGVSKEEFEDLENVIQDWADRNKLNPEFYEIDNTSVDAHIYKNNL